MAYLCTRCEAEDHSALAVQAVRTTQARVDDGQLTERFTVVTYCERCSSNTVHISDPEAFDENGQ